VRILSKKIPPGKFCSGKQNQKIGTVFGGKQTVSNDQKLKIAYGCYPVTKYISVLPEKIIANMLNIDEDQINRAQNQTQ